MKKQPPGEFEKAASAQSHRGCLNELWSFLKTNKKWWLLPIIIVLLDKQDARRTNNNRHYDELRHWLNYSFFYQNS
jgi:hypothetical protein